MLQNHFHNMNCLSDSDSTDSDDGIRFKTDSIRNKTKTENRSRSRSPVHKQSYSRKHPKRTSHNKHRRRKSSTSSNSDDKDYYKKRKNENKVGRSSKERGPSHFEKCAGTSSTNKSKLEVVRPAKKIDYKGEVICVKQNEISDNKESVQNIGPALPAHPEKIGPDSHIGPTNIGPALPPRLMKEDCTKSASHSEADVAMTMGPALPPHLSTNLTKTSTEIIGPALPPHLTQTKDVEICAGPISPSDKLSEIVESSIEIIGPALPHHLTTKTKGIATCVGPTLPPHLSNNLLSETVEESSTNIIGPALPPHLLTKTKDVNTCVGPVLPPHLSTTMMETEEEPPVKNIGPTLPPHLRQKLLEQSSQIVADPVEEEDEDEDYGPLPVGDIQKLSKAHIALEERALQLKMDQLDPQDSKIKGREEWMLELPEVKAANFGLGPRQFRSKIGPDLSDRSSWTDTPEDKEKKKINKEVPVEVDLQKEAELKEIKRRDKEQEALSKKHKKKNKESLLEIHQKKMKKEEKKSGPSERRPFSREIDLQVNRFDEAQKKAVLKKASLLDDRFSSGQSKFL